MPTTMAACRSCGRPIFWAVTGRGSNMPCDWVPVLDGNLVVEPGTGLVRVLRDGEQVPQGTDRFVSHFVTCPQGAKWRKR